MNPIAAILRTRAATLAARRRTGDDSIGTSSVIGYWRAERLAVLSDGARIVKPLTGWTKAEKVIEYLDAL